MELIPKAAAILISVATMPPVVVSTVPRSGDKAVDPSITELRVTFSKDMMDGNWSWTQISDETFPPTTGKPRYLDDKRTCVLPVKLEPGKTYVTWLNSAKYGNFKDADGRSAVPYLLVFETAKADVSSAWPLVLGVTGRDLVKIDTGSDDGVHVGMRLDVVRIRSRASRYVGRVEVVQADADSSLCKADPRYLKMPIHEGDRVVPVGQLKGSMEKKSAVEQPSPKRSWGPEQATGAPDTDRAVDYYTAWASKTQDDQREWLELEYDRPIKATEVRVYESYCPGALSKITVYDRQGQEALVWSLMYAGRTVDTTNGYPGIPRTVTPGGVVIPKFPVEVDFEIQRVRLDLDSPRVKGWNEIDAVGLVDEKGEVHWATKAKASSTFARPWPEKQATPASDATLQRQQAKAQLSLIESALQMYHLDSASYPKTAEGLKALITRPDDSRGSDKWNGPYLKAPLSADPWGNAYQYRAPGQHNPRSFDLWSPGPDGKSDTQDDLGNWEGDPGSGSPPR